MPPFGCVETRWFGALRRLRCDLGVQPLDYDADARRPPVLGRPWFDASLVQQARGPRVRARLAERVEHHQAVLALSLAVSLGGAEVLAAGALSVVHGAQPLARYVGLELRDRAAVWLAFHSRVVPSADSTPTSRI